jgi:Mg-chelatase subunit ChlD
MNILDFTWNTFNAITGLEYDNIRLVLEPSIPRPMVGREGKGFLVKLPIPRFEKNGVYCLHGLYEDSEDQNWSVLWRLYRASVYHSAFHILSPPLSSYSTWAHDKDYSPAMFTVSLLEDYRVTLAARAKWTQLLSDIAFANYVGAKRMGNVDAIESTPLRFACKLLLSLWGMGRISTATKQEDRHIAGLAEKARTLLESENNDPEPGKACLQAADIIYDEVSSRGRFAQIPSFPHTEAHSSDSLFGSTLVEDEEPDGLTQCFEALGIPTEEPRSRTDLGESREALFALDDSRLKASKIAEKYVKELATTKLKGIEFPSGDFASFMRSRAEVAGAIRNIKNQLLQVKNVTDEEPGKDSGQLYLPAAMQVIASESLRTDAFAREELLVKDESWVILLDASSSLGKAAFEIRTIAVCLAEVAKDLMTEKGRWAMLAFNDRLQILKDFEENYTMDHKARIGGLTQRGPTYLPDALSVAAKVLSSRPVEAKFLVVVSDCLATGYEGIEEEMEKVASSLGKKGVMMVGLGIQSSAVKEYFKVASVLNSHYEIMKTFVRAYLELSSSI